MSGPVTGIRLGVKRFQRAGLLAQAGKAIASNDGYFREVLNALPAAVYITDAEGVITYYNEAAAEFWGVYPELGTNQWCGSWKLFWPDGRSLPHDQCPMAIALREQRPVRGMEAIAERPDGVRAPFIPYPTPFFDESGALLGAINMLVDITDRKRAEEHARRLASIVDSSDDAIVSTDLDGVITSWNRGAERVFGYTASEVIGKPISILIPPGRENEESEILARVRLGEKIDHYETIRRRKDGRLIDIFLTVSPIRNAENQIVGASKIARDITDRRIVEQTTERLAAVVETSNDAILTKNLDGIITSWNKGAERIFGYTASEMIGQPVTMLIPADKQDEEPRILARIRAGERIEHYETVRRRKNGSLVDISLTVSPLKNAKGVIVGASKIARDITEWRGAREQQDLLLREMDHRIRNLFSLASGVVNLSARTANTPQELAASVRDRLMALSRAHGLTLAKPADEQLAEHPATLHALIRTIASPYEERAQHEKERVVVSGPDAPLSNGSVTSLALLLHEFATNAAKYGALSTSSGSVHIHCAEDGDRFEVTWRERGGPRVDRPTDREGFGSLLARTAVKGQLGGTISHDWAPEGLTIRLCVARDRLVG
jgi:PAS domain S-box-containing protein